MIRWSDRKLKSKRFRFHDVSVFVRCNFHIGFRDVLSVQLSRVGNSSGEVWISYSKPFSKEYFIFQVIFGNRSIPAIQGNQIELLMQWKAESTNNFSSFCWKLIKFRQEIEWITTWHQKLMQQGVFFTLILPSLFGGARLHSQIHVIIFFIFRTRNRIMSVYVLCAFTLFELLML